MKIVVTGATGWLGQATLHAINKLDLISSIDELILFGSHSRVFNDLTYGDLFVNNLSDLSLKVDPADLFVHLAFKTRDYVTKMAPDEYVAINQSILENALSFLRTARPKSVILVSSGVVSRHAMTSGLSDVGPYTEMKILEEELFALACDEIDASLFILRLWGASGEHMTEPKKYVIGELISQALYSEHLTVTSANKVYRRYMDASQLMAVSLRAVLDGQNEIVDSGGEIVEMETLAARIRDLLSPDKQIIRHEKPVAVPDIYLSTSVRMEELAEQYSVQLFNMDEQIRRTSIAVIRDSK
jgi:nucleoside-diphosphate-sugar epimerase